MSAQAKVYSLDACAVAFLGVPLSGYGSGGAIEIEKVDPTFKHVVGQDGEVARYKTGNKVYKITIKLIQTSAVNAILSAIQNLDEESNNGTGVGPFTLFDTQGVSTFIASQAWLEGPPKAPFEAEPKDREWTIYAADGTHFVGGN